MEMVADKISQKITVLRVKGRIDAITAPELEKAVIEALNEKASGLIINLADVDYMSSAGIRVLVLGSKTAISGLGLFYICSLKESVRKVLEIVGFLPLLEVFEDEATGITSARGKLEGNS
jgi:anti-anti-sigma factor